MCSTCRAFSLSCALPRSLWTLGALSACACALTKNRAKEASRRYRDLDQDLWAQDVQLVARSRLLRFDERRDYIVFQCDLSILSLFLLSLVQFVCRDLCSLLCLGSQRGQRKFYFNKIQSV